MKRTVGSKRSGRIKVGLAKNADYSFQDIKKQTQYFDKLRQKLELE